MNRLEHKQAKRARRKAHVRKRISGTAERPRLTVYRSARYIYIQAIDDAAGRTLAAASNREKALAAVKSTVAGGAQLGEVIGQRLKEKGLGGGRLRPQRLRLPRGGQGHRRRRPQGRGEVLRGEQLG